MAEITSKKIYFASDFHLGAPDYASSRQREDKIVAWLNHIESDCKELFLVGDIFDFWFEYKSAVPKGYARLFGKIAAFTDQGIPVHLFCGNHDMWMFGYLEQELGVILHRDEFQFERNGKKFFVAHGDGLGPGDNGYKFIKKVFRNPLSQWAFARLHPNFGIWLASYFSKTSRASNASEDALYVGTQREWLYQFVANEHKQLNADIYLFGHRHLPLKFEIQGSFYYNLGEWLNYFTFGSFDGENFLLQTWKNNVIEPYITIPEQR